MDRKVEGSDLGDDIGQSNSGESRWQRLKKNLFLDESTLTLSASVSPFPKLKFQSDCLIGLGHNPICRPEKVGKSGLTVSLDCIQYGRSSLKMPLQEKENRYQ